ncbi:MAG: hypothetical protein QNJ85_18975 [Gammaproteobacteria bacterium]|nr:hypothetical protein [Gammaproteobacteria bacterium]
MKKLALVLLGLACTTTVAYAQNYSFNRVMVVNNSDQLLRDVSVRDVRTGRVIDCDDVGPLRVCRQNLGSRRLGDGNFEITLAQGDAAPRTESFTPSVPAYYSTGRALQMIFDISEKGELSFYFKQESAFR